MAARLVDIAEKAGVSASAVSRVLRNPDKKIDISEAARQRIMQVAKELNYRPHAGARAMKNQKFDAVGVLVNPVGGSEGALVQLLPYHRALIQHLSDHQLNVVIICTGGDTLDTQCIPSQLTDRRFDGLVVTIDVNQDLNQVINNMDIPVLWLNSQKRRGVNIICPDDRTLGYLNTLALLAIGHRHIAVSNASQIQSYDQYRLDGYHHAMAQFKLKPDPSASELVQRHGYQKQFDRWMDEKQNYTAYIGMNPMIAECLGSFLMRRRIFPGQNVALISMDRGPWDYLYPCISGMQVPGVLLGHTAADVLHQMIKSRIGAGKRHVDIAPEWMGGETLCPGNDSHEAKVLCEELMQPDADIIKLLASWIDHEFINVTSSTV